MKPFLLIFFLPFCALAAKSPKDPALSQTFHAQCVKCGAKNDLKPTAARTNGARTIFAEGNEPIANILEKTLTFKCPACREKFEQPTEVAVAIPPKAKLIRIER